MMLARAGLVNQLEVLPWPSPKAATSRQKCLFGRDFLRFAHSQAGGCFSPGSQVLCCSKRTSARRGNVAFGGSSSYGRRAARSPCSHVGTLELRGSNTVMAHPRPRTMILPFGCCRDASHRDAATGPTQIDEPSSLLAAS